MSDVQSSRTRRGRAAVRTSGDGHACAPRPADAAADLAHFAAEINYRDLNEAARRAVSFSIADTLAVSVAGAGRGSGHGQLLGLAQSVGGAPEAHIIGRKGQVPALMAALANGATARAMNFDDGHDEGSTHPSAIVVPAAIAMAERVGAIDGATLLAAVAAGNEIVCRMGRALARRPGGLPLDRWFLTSVLGVFGATAACCRILGLGPRTTQHAFGIVLFETGGTLEAFSPEGQAAMVRGMIAGFAAKSGVLAALMAETGITGVPDSLEGRFGLFPAFFDGRYDRGALLAQLGQDWAVADIGLKAWPTVRYASAYIDAIRRLVGATTVRPEDIAEIRVHVAGYAATRCEPLERQRRPTNYNNAGHALPYLVAAMAARRTLTIDDLTTRLDDPVVLELAQRVIPVHDLHYGGDNRIGPAKVAVTTRSGDVLQCALPCAYGDPRDPMSWVDLSEKIRSCLRLGPRELSPTAAEEVLEILARLPDVADISQLIRRLA